MKLRRRRIIKKLMMSLLMMLSFSYIIFVFLITKIETLKFTLVDFFSFFFLFFSLQAMFNLINHLYEMK